MEAKKTIGEANRGGRKISLSRAAKILTISGGAVLLLILLAVGSFGGWYLKSFSRAAKVAPKEVVSQVWRGLRRPYKQRYLTFLILGLDKRPDNPTLLTDTILMVTLDTTKGNYLLFSLPRDLWIEDLRTKINALYYYGRERDKNDPTKLVRKRLEKLTGQRIDNTIVLTMENVRDLIDILGGVNVYVERSFSDHQFPRDDGSYGVKTISFKKGWQSFNGQRALEFLRSRKSNNPLEGNDEARQARQQKVILALKTKLLKSPRLFLNPDKIGSLYAFFEQKMLIAPRIDLGTIVSWWPWAWRFLKGQEIGAEVPWKGKDAILQPGYDRYYGSWILKPRNGDWQPLHDFFQNEIKKING